jgi:Tfp pilus assembly protein PilN
VAIIIFYVPEIFVHNYFENKIKEEEEILAQLTAGVNKLAEEIKKEAGAKAQLDAYQKQFEKLTEREQQVDEILKIRTNPKKVLEKIARSMPEDLWLTELRINENKEVVIIGGADSSRSIGEFISIINDSPFFANTVTPVRQENKQETVDGVSGNYEQYELKGKIKNYDMRSR